MNKQMQGSSRHSPKEIHVKSASLEVDEHQNQMLETAYP